MSSDLDMVYLRWLFYIGVETHIKNEVNSWVRSWGYVMISDILILRMISMDGNSGDGSRWNHQARKNLKQHQEVQAPKELKAALIFKDNKEGLTKEIGKGEARIIRKPRDGQVMAPPGRSTARREEGTAVSHAIKRLHKMRWERCTLN